MRDAAGSRWRLLDPSGIRIRRFGDEALVFNPLSWETHLLNDTAVRVLDVLSMDPKSEDRIVEEVCGPEDGVGEPDPLRAEIGRFLRELGSLGLAEHSAEVEDEARRPG